MKFSPKKRDTPVDVSRYAWAIAVVGCVFFVLTMRLWYLQIYKGETFRQISSNNRLRKIEIPASRGLLFDRYGTLILGNRPFFDLVYIPQYVVEPEKTIQILSNILFVPESQFHSILKKNRSRPRFLPIVILRNLTLHQVSLIQTHKLYLPGIEVEIAPRRDYTGDTPPHLVGYIGEISGNKLEKENLASPDNPYFPGDLVGKHGLESRWEKVLRGQRGYRFIQVDAFGRQRQVSTNQNWNLPEQAAQPGADLTLTIDFELQKIVAQAFKGKNGAVVVMNPQTGEVLAMLSEPGFDPAMYQEPLSYDQWESLLADPYKPLFDKTTGGSFAPGSVYKPVVALAALEEGIIQPKTHFFCNGVMTLGNQPFHCYKRTGHGTVDLAEALKKSCDVFFYNIGLSLGVERIAKYAMDLGLGAQLGIELNQEDPGLIPTTAWHRKLFKSGWNLGDIPSMAIGQGANLLTPIQIASLYATIANGGTVWRPYVVQKVTDHVGQKRFEQHPVKQKTATFITQKNFAMIREYLGQVVMDPKGTGHKANVPGISVAGKTGSAQVVNLGRYRHRKNEVSMKWQEHAIFGAFSPIEGAEISLAILSENDGTGGGGVAAAPIAKKIIQGYWELKAKRMKAMSHPMQATEKPHVVQ